MTLNLKGSQSRVPTSRCIWWYCWVLAMPFLMGTQITTCLTHAICVANTPLCTHTSTVLYLKHAGVDKIFWTTRKCGKARNLFCLFSKILQSSFHSQEFVSFSRRRLSIIFRVFHARVIRLMKWVFCWATRTQESFTEKAKRYGKCRRLLVIDSRRENVCQ